MRDKSMKGVKDESKFKARFDQYGAFDGKG